jgi:hypothetical protein
MPTVEQRLERLERSQKRYRFATIGLLCLMIAGVSMGQTKGVEDIVCRSVTVVQDDGFPVVKIKAWDLGGQITVMNDKLLPTTIISQTDDGGGLIGIYSSLSKKLVLLGGIEDGGKINIYNKTGEEIITMLADDYGNGVVGVWNRKGKGRTLESK